MALKGDAAAERSINQLSRDFPGRSIFDFCNNICQKAEVAGQQALSQQFQRALTGWHGRRAIDKITPSQHLSMAALLQKKALVHRDPKKASKQVVMANVFRKLAQRAAVREVLGVQRPAANMVARAAAAGPTR